MNNEIKEVAVLYGSDSTEWEISCRSGLFTASRIDCGRFNVYEVFARFGRWQVVAYRKNGGARVEIAENGRPEINKDDFSAVVDGVKVKFDFVYMMQHGTPGENGKMQGFFEMLGVPYSGCDAFVSAMTFDKFSCKSYLRNTDFVKCARDIFIRKSQMPDDIAAKAAETLGLPLFVKPTAGGSSFGVTKVKSVEEFGKALEYAFTESDTVLAEAAVAGRELTCAVYFDGRENVTLPITEIISDNEYFDYEAKYNGQSQEICPAGIDDAVAAHISETSKKIYTRLGCSGLVRIDYILAADGLYFLEVNTTPGMTAASLVPKMVRAAGLDMTEFLSTIIDNSPRNRR